MLCTTMFCVAENASVTGNFAHKTEAYANRQNEGFTLPEKSGLDKSGQAPIMGRITYERTIAQFSCKLSCDPKLWNARESRLMVRAVRRWQRMASWNACYSRYNLLIKTFATVVLRLQHRTSRSCFKEVCKLKPHFWNDTTEWSRKWSKRWVLK